MLDHVIRQQRRLQLSLERGREALSGHSSSYFTLPGVAFGYAVAGCHSFLLSLHEFHDLCGVLGMDQGFAKGLGFGEFGDFGQGLDMGTGLVRGGQQ